MMLVLKQRRSGKTFFLSIVTLHIVEHDIDAHNDIKKIISRSRFEFICYIVKVHCSPFTISLERDVCRFLLPVEIKKDIYFVRENKFKQ